MEHDREKQVWQRVMGQEEAEPVPNLRGLIRESAEQAAVFQRLAQKLTGREQQLARQLLELEQSNGACLRGIAALSGDRMEALKRWEPSGGKNGPEACYRRGIRCQREYTARSLDLEFGILYRSLAQRQERMCMLIAELMGWMG